MDSGLRVWCHAFEENSVKPLEPPRLTVDESLNGSRRQFLGTAAMALAAAPLGAFCSAGADTSDSRQLEALGAARQWINSPRLTPANLGGKVVVVDFCTYTCINWLRTLPYRRAWAHKYGPGLVLIGVHTPEFGFERDLDNVRRAIRQMKVEYPVVLDNDYAIWRAFDNHYWPALYFIDARGRVREHHFGEGEYDRSELVIQRLLTDAGVGSSAARSSAAGVGAVDGAGVEAAADWSNLKSPENYLGYRRTGNFVSPGGVTRNRRRLYAAPARLALNQWALAGDWTIGPEAITLSSPPGRLVCRFHARDLHLVMGSPQPATSIRFRVSLDGQPPGPAHGLDVDEAGNGPAAEQRLYQLIRQPGPIRDRQCEIEFLDAGVEAFAFTFG